MIDEYTGILSRIFEKRNGLYWLLKSKMDSLIAFEKCKCTFQKRGEVCLQLLKAILVQAYLTIHLKISCPCPFNMKVPVVHKMKAICKMQGRTQFFHANNRMHGGKYTITCMNWPEALRIRIHTISPEPDP